MNDDDLCRAELEPGLRCGLPAGHDGDTHKYEGELPPVINQLVAYHVDLLEEQTRKTRRARTWLYWALALNLFAAFWNFAGIITQWLNG